MMKRKEVLVMVSTLSLVGATLLSINSNNKAYAMSEPKWAYLVDSSPHSFTLSVNDTGSTYQWQISEDGEEWNNLVGKTSKEQLFEEEENLEFNEKWVRCVVDNTKNSLPIQLLRPSYIAGQYPRDFKVGDVKWTKPYNIRNDDGVYEAPYYASNGTMAYTLGGEYGIPAYLYDWDRYGFKKEEVDFSDFPYIKIDNEYWEFDPEEEEESKAFVYKGPMFKEDKISYKFFDVVGRYDVIKGATTEKYMMGTSYNSRWTLTTKNPDGKCYLGGSIDEEDLIDCENVFDTFLTDVSLTLSRSHMCDVDSLVFSFSDPNSLDYNPYVLHGEAKLSQDVDSFAFGADTMLGNYETSGDFSDNAALVTQYNGNEVKNYALIGSKTIENAEGDEPCIVITPVTKKGDYSYYIGRFDLVKFYEYNVGLYAGTSIDKFQFKDVTKSDGTKEKIVFAMQDCDSGMSCSWAHIGKGESVKFDFGVGSAESVGVVQIKSKSQYNAITITEPIVGVRYGLFEIDGTLVCDYVLAETSDPIEFKGLVTGHDYLVRTILPDGGEEYVDFEVSTSLKTNRPSSDDPDAPAIEHTIVTDENGASTVTFNNLYSNGEIYYVLRSSDGNFYSSEPKLPVNNSVTFEDVPPGIHLYLTSTNGTKTDYSSSIKFTEEEFVVKTKKMEAPTVDEFTTNNETIFGKEDGSIVAVDSSIQYEYSYNPSDDFRPFRNGMAKKLGGGTYYVRRAGTDYYLPSDPIEINIVEGEFIKFVAPEGINITSDSEEYAYFDSAVLILELQEGEAVDEELIVTVGGKERKFEMVEEGVYQYMVPFIQSENDLVITDIKGIVDGAPPVIKATYGETIWDTIDGLGEPVYSYNPVTVIISAGDSSGIKSTQYLISNTLIEGSLEDVDASRWINCPSEGVVLDTTEDTASLYLYVRSEDNVGNVSYIRTDEITLDRTFIKYKDSVKTSVNAYANSDDSTAVKSLFTDALSDIDELEFDDDLSMDDNKALVDAIYTQLCLDVDAQRALDNVERFNTYKNTKEEAINNSLSNNESNATNLLVENGLNGLHNLEYDVSKTLNQNLDTVDALINALIASINTQRNLDKPTFNAPTIKTGLIYNGNNQALINAGSTTCGTLYYAFDSGSNMTTESLEGWSQDLNTIVKKNAGKYVIKYFVWGDATHNNSAIGTLEVTIGKYRVTVTAKDASKEKGQTDPHLFYEMSTLITGETPVITIARGQGENTGVYDITITKTNDPINNNYELVITNAKFKILWVNNSSEIKEEGNEVIKVESTHGIDPSIHLVTEKIEEKSEDYNNALEQVKKNSSFTKGNKILAVYDVSLIDDNNVKHQPDGTLKIHILVPKGLDVTKDFKVFHIHENESKVLEHEVDGNYVVVSTNELSSFLIVQKSKSCSFHWVLVPLLVLYVAFTIVWFLVFEKRKLDLVSISVSAGFGVLSLVFGILGAVQGCIACLVLLIVNLVVDCLGVCFFVYNDKLFKKEEETEK